MPPWIIVDQNLNRPVVFFMKPARQVTDAARRLAVAGQQNAMYLRQTSLPERRPHWVPFSTSRTQSVQHLLVELSGLDDRRHLITIFAEPGAVDAIEVFRGKLEAG
jgi:hypothetical protein